MSRDMDFNTASLSDMQRVAIAYPHAATTDFHSYMERSMPINVHHSISYFAFASVLVTKEIYADSMMACAGYQTNFLSDHAESDYQKIRLLEARESQLLFMTFLSLISFAESEARQKLVQNALVLREQALLISAENERRKKLESGFFGDFLKTHKDHLSLKQLKENISVVTSFTQKFCAMRFKELSKTLSNFPDGFMDDKGNNKTLLIAERYSLSILMGICQNIYNVHKVKLMICMLHNCVGDIKNIWNSSLVKNRTAYFSPAFKAQCDVSVITNFIRDVAPKEVSLIKLDPFLKKPERELFARVTHLHSYILSYPVKFNFGFITDQSLKSQFADLVDHLILDLLESLLENALTSNPHGKKPEWLLMCREIDNKLTHIISLLPKSSSCFAKLLPNQQEFRAAYRYLDSGLVQEVSANTMRL